MFLFETGVYNLKQENYTKGIELLLQALQVDSKNISALIALSDAYHLQGEREKEIEVLQTILDLGSSNVKVISSLIFSLIRIGKIKL